MLLIIYNYTYNYLAGFKKDSEPIALANSLFSVYTLVTPASYNLLSIADVTDSSKETLPTK
jgi:hypothetical protein